jgi:hypothetical protein
MVLLETIASSLVIAWFMPGIIMRTECWIRCMTRRSLDSVPEDLIKYDKNEENDIVLNDSVKRITTVLQEILQESEYGLLVISAPAGTGKSTYLMKALQNMTPKRRMKIFTGGSYLQDFKKILSAFGIPGYAKLSRYLPEKSIVIIDQVDFTGAAFNETIQGNITELATDSHNSKKYLVILCVSDANFAKKVLLCNGGEKINLAVPPEILKWTRIDAENFIRMKNIPEDRIQFLLDLFAPCYNPQIMRDYFKRRGWWTDDAIRSRSEVKEERWDEFETHITFDVIRRYLVPIP